MQYAGFDSKRSASSENTVLNLLLRCASGSKIPKRYGDLNFATDGIADTARDPLYVIPTTSVCWQEQEEWTSASTSASSQLRLRQHLCYAYDFCSAAGAYL